MVKELTHYDYVENLLSEIDKEENLLDKKSLKHELDKINDLILALYKIKDFKEGITKFDTGILFIITDQMKLYVKKISKFSYDRDTISDCFGLTQILVSALFNELYRTDRNFTSKWEILDEINDFFINFLNKELGDAHNSDLSKTSTIVLIMMRQIYKINILKLYTDSRLTEHKHDINETIRDNGITYVSESELEFYAKVEDAMSINFKESDSIKKIIDDIF